MKANPVELDEHYIIMIYYRVRLSLKKQVSTLLATGFYSGFSPKLPGTSGSIAVIPLLLLLDRLPPLSRLIFWIIVFILGIWSTIEFTKVHKKIDDSRIVIDEFLGMAVTMSVFPLTAKTLGVGFLLFRIFDIFKPPPIRYLDQWSKKIAKNQIGSVYAFGVIADDLLAGLFAGLALFMIRHYNLI